MKIVFMGTPFFAAKALEAILSLEKNQQNKHQVIGVYTQPDKEAGRGKKLKASEVKQLALEHNIPVYQPVNFKDPKDIQELASLEADIFIVAAYGLILPQAVLDLPKLGAYNIHGSLLPKLRGASPIQTSLLQGDILTGITIMQMEAGLDSGPMLLQKVLAIAPNDTAPSLQEALAEQGAELILLALETIAKGELALIPQNNQLVTYAKKISKQDGLIDWSKPAEEIRNQIRAYYAWPNSYSYLQNEKKLKVTFDLPEVELAAHQYAMGQVLGLTDKHLKIACQDGFLLFPNVKPEGKNFMSAEAFWNGYLAKNTCVNYFATNSGITNA